MAFSNPWDVTQPPDTQAAKLLGQDIRNLKTDISQRFAAVGFGLAASMVNLDPASFGGTSSGILFLTTDTRKAYQWNGTTWVEVPSWELRTFRTSTGSVAPNSAQTTNVLFSNFADTNYTVVGCVITDTAASGGGYLQVLCITAKAVGSVSVLYKNTDPGAAHTGIIELTLLHD